MLGFIFGTGLYIANHKKIRLTSKKPCKIHTLLTSFHINKKRRPRDIGSLATKCRMTTSPPPLNPLPPAKPKNPMAAAKPTINAHIPKVEIITKSLGKDVIFVGKMQPVGCWFVRNPVNSPVEEKVVEIP